jgi:ribosomal subunit interface protein
MKTTSQLRVVFAGLDKTQAIEDFIKDKFGKILEDFSGIKDVSGTVCVAMENSPQKAGRDSFRCKIAIRGIDSSQVILEKSGLNLYQVISLVSDKLEWKMRRVKSRMSKSRRRIKASLVRFAKAPA